MNEGVSTHHHTLVVLVENKAGVLARVAGLFARRGFNIESLAVAPTDDERFSRITIVVDAATAPLEQIVKQLNKLINVVKISELADSESVLSELLVATVSATAAERSQVIELIDVYQGKILGVGHAALTVSLNDRPDRIDDFEVLLRPCGIFEGWSTLKRSISRGGASRTRRSYTSANSRNSKDRTCTKPRSPIPDWCTCKG